MRERQRVYWAVAALVSVTLGAGLAAAPLLLLLALGPSRSRAWVAPTAVLIFVVPGLWGPELDDMRWTPELDDVRWDFARAVFLENAHVNIAAALVLVVGSRAAAARWVGPERCARWHRAAWMSTAGVALWASHEWMRIGARLMAHPRFVPALELRATVFTLEPVASRYHPPWQWLSLVLAPLVLAAWVEFRGTRTHIDELWVLLAPALTIAAMALLALLER